MSTGLKLPEDIQAYNMQVYYSNRKSGTFICTKCKKYTFLEGSYSNKGYALQCASCVRASQAEKNLDFTSYLSQHIWGVEIPVAYWKYIPSTKEDQDFFNI